MNGKKDAQKDAREYARAMMFYGKGAGNRRKLIRTTVEYKRANLPGYSEAFAKALESQDMLDHAVAARRERRRRDLSHTVERNVRGLTRGNRRSLTGGVSVLMTVAYWAHETGYDKVAIKQAKVKYEDAKKWVHKKRVNLKSV